MKNWRVPYTLESMWPKLKNHPDILKYPSQGSQYSSRYLKPGPMEYVEPGVITRPWLSLTNVSYENCSHSTTTPPTTPVLFFPKYLGFPPHLWPYKIIGLSESQPHISVPEWNPRTGTIQTSQTYIRSANEGFNSPPQHHSITLSYTHTLSDPVKCTPFLLQRYFGTN
jgi:hypothetical protein